MDFSLLIKISEEKYIDRIQKKGEFYCNPLSYFREIENDSYRGDPNEGKQYIKQVKNLELYLEDKRIGWAHNAQLFPNNYDKGNIFCFYGFQTANLDLSSKEKQKVNLEIQSERLGKYALIIFDLPEFKRRLKRCFRSLDRNYQINAVRYVDFNSYEGELTPFMKSDKYICQREIRIWIPNKKDDKYIFHLGSISDISYKCKIEDLHKIEIEVLS